MWLARRLLWDPLFLGYRGAIGREKAVGVVGNSGAAWLCLAGCWDPAGCRSTTTFPWGPQVNSLMCSVQCAAGSEGEHLCSVLFHGTPQLEGEIRSADTPVCLSKCKKKNRAGVWPLRVPGLSSTPCSNCVKSEHLRGCQRLHFHIALAGCSPFYFQFCFC